MNFSPTDMVAFFEWPDAARVGKKDHGVPVKGPLPLITCLSGWRTKRFVGAKGQNEAAGFWVSEVIDHGFIYSIYTFDPNNIPIEFSVAVRNIDLQLPGWRTDGHPSPAAMEGRTVPGHWPTVSRPTQPSERTVFPGEGGFSPN
ncbi:MAG: hypothetical protein R2861_00460 [Desulfobacterales bacterium]